MSAEHGEQSLPGGGVAVPGVEVGGQAIRRHLLGLFESRSGELRKLKLRNLLGRDDRDIELAHKHLLAQYLPGGTAGFAALQSLLQPRFLFFTQHLPLWVVEIIFKKRLDAAGPLNAFAVIELLVAAHEACV